MATSGNNGRKASGFPIAKRRASRRRDSTAPAHMLLSLSLFPKMVVHTGITPFRSWQLAPWYLTYDTAPPRAAIPLLV